MTPTCIVYYITLNGVMLATIKNDESQESKIKIFNWLSISALLCGGLLLPKLLQTGGLMKLVTDLVTHHNSLNGEEPTETLIKVKNIF